MLSPLSALRQLHDTRADFGGGAGARKLALLRGLESARLPSAGAVERLHEALCFLRAYPDNKALHAQVERMLAAFATRDDLEAHRAALADSGIAGTDIDFVFFQPTASRLARSAGDAMTVDWREFEKGELLERMLPLLTLYTESPGLDEIAYETRRWIDVLKGQHETDAAFIIRRFDALRVDPFTREKLYDELSLPIHLAPGPTTPSRTHAVWPRARVVTQRGPLSRARPAIPDDVLRPPRSIKAVPQKEARVLIDLARDAMVTRSRDLDVFAWADVRDVRIIDCGDGLQFACLGAIPERRLLLESVYGFLTLRAGVPIGYVLCSALYGSSEIAYNVFDTWRGAEAARIYGHVLSTVHHVFGSDAFTIYPYQLGHENEEGIASGAWWFYYKLGFRPRDPATIRIMNRELARMKRDPSHRSTPKVLRALAENNLYLHLGKARHDVIGLLSLPDVGLRASRYLARRFGSNREAAESACAEDARQLLGGGPARDWSAGERLAWARWAPLVLILPEVARWSPAERAALIDVIRAKGSRRESDFVRRFDLHQPLRRALRRLARD